ncbi:MAG: hypothetical protein C0599_04480 [Salinivirgaceae bacterium]|nr:MAG: hypothetical protein C0599_04480 [Salinivirgaceae bacterium]
MTGDGEAGMDDHDFFGSYQLCLAPWFCGGGGGHRNDDGNDVWVVVSPHPVYQNYNHGDVESSRDPKRS